MTKKCDLCNSEPHALFRCSYGKSKTWKFLCKLCLEKIKSSFEETLLHFEMRPINFNGKLNKKDCLKEMSDYKIN